MRNIFLKLRKKISNTKKGFTLVELLVVFFIMASILAVVIPGYLDYSTKLELQNLALDVALTIREAQVYGAGARVTSGGSFTTGYGVHFDKSDPTHFIFFENSSNDGSGGGNWNRYTTDDNEIDTYTMKNGYSIYALCDSNDPTNCDNASDSLGSLDVVFQRPNPDATVRTGPGSTANGYSGTGGVNGWIILISPDQATTTIGIEETGAVFIE